MSQRSVAVLEFHLAKYRRSWRSSVFNALATPILLLVGIGLSLGTYVNKTGALGMPYVQFVAPGLLASSSLQLAMTESGAPILSSFKWEKTFFDMAAAPVRAMDMLLGQLAYLALRILPAAVVFTVLILPFGAARSPWAALLPLIAVLVGLAGATPMFAYSASIDSPNTMSIVLRLIMLPMTLFSGVFFPISSLPAVLLPLAYALPLWHGVALSRDVADGSGSLMPDVMHLIVLALWCGLGLMLAQARFVARLTRQ